MVSCKVTCICKPLFHQFFPLKLVVMNLCGLAIEQAGMVEFLGMLKVRIVRGINLAVRDLLSSDPYVTATLGTQVFTFL